MKIITMSKLFAAMAAIALCLSSTGLAAEASDNSEDITEGYTAERPIHSWNGDFIFIYDNGAEENSDISLYAENSQNADAQADEFLERCKGTPWGYSQLHDYPYMSRYIGADTAKKLYNNLYATAVKLWNNPEDVTPQNVVVSGTTYKALVSSEPVPELANFSWNSIPLEDAYCIIDEINNLYFTFCHDNPIFYYFGTAAIGSSSGKIHIVMKDSNYKSGETRSTLQAAVKSFLESTDNGTLVKNDYTRTDYQNAFELYKTVMNRMEYAKDSSGRVSDNQTAYNIIGGIVGENDKDEGISKRKCVCEGYAKIYKLLLNYHGIDNIYVTGTGFGSNGSEGHAWNMVMMDDGRYYFADSTWDDRGYYNLTSNTYFAKGVTTFQKDHTLDSPQRYRSDPDHEDYLYPVPPVPTEDFDPSTDHKAENTRLIDFNKDKSVNNLDIKTLQEMLGSGEYNAAQNSYFDINNDNKLNNRDLKSLQKLIISL